MGAEDTPDLDRNALSSNERRVWKHVSDQYCTAQSDFTAPCHAMGLVSLAIFRTFLSLPSFGQGGMSPHTKDWSIGAEAVKPRGILLIHLLPSCIPI